MKKNNKKRQLQLVSFCVIPMILLLIFHYFPLVGVLIAFKDYKYNLGILGSEWIGLDNFKALFFSSDMHRIVGNTAFLNGMIIIAEVLLSVLLALALYGIKNRKMAKRYQAVLTLPFLVSWVALGYLVHAFLNPSYGIITNLQSALGADVIYWHSEPQYWPYILIISSTWKNIGFGSILYYMVLSGIHSDTLEAAVMEGASGLQKLRYVILPALMPMVTVMLLYKLGGIFKSDFDLFYQLTRGMDTLNSSTEVLDTYIYKTMRIQGNMGMAATTGAVQSLAGMVMVLLVSWLVRKYDPERSLF